MLLVDVLIVLASAALKQELEGFIDLRMSANLSNKGLLQETKLEQGN